MLSSFFAARRSRTMNAWGGGAVSSGSTCKPSATGTVRRGGCTDPPLPGVDGAERGRRDQRQRPHAAGRHVVRARIGGGHDPRAIFVGVARPAISGHPRWLKRCRQDWILGRILWLSGCEAGRKPTRCGGSDDATSTYTARPTTSRWASRASRLRANASGRDRRTV